MSETEEMANSIVPFMHDEKKSRYITKRICNFSVREACQLANVTEKSVRRWREADSRFNHLDTEGLTELRKTFANEFIDMQFTRNFHLVLEKDFKILYKDATDVELTEKESDYLIKMRSHYTPQALAVVKQLLSGGTIEEPFNFTKTVMTIRREKQEIEFRME